MPKAGKYEYPIKDLDDCINYITKAHEVAKSLVMTREGFSKNIDMSFKGGAFGMLVGSIGMFGLVETGDGNIRYTQLAEKILFGQPKEQEEAKNQAVRNIELFEEIFNRYGDNPTQEQIRHILREKAGVSLSEEAKLATEVGKLFKSNVKHLKSIGGEPKKMHGSMIQPQFTGDGFFTITAQGLTIEVDNLMKLSLVEKMVEDVKKKLTSEQNKEKQNSSNHIKGEKDSPPST